MDKQDVIAEIRRVAELLQTRSLSKQQFSQYSNISENTVRYTFGSWNAAIQAAGLSPNPSGLSSGSRVALPDDLYLQEIIRLTKELGKQPTEAQLAARGRYSVKPYRTRWDSLDKACRVAYAKYGFPAPGENEDIEQPAQEILPIPSQAKRIIPDTHKPQEAKQRKKVQFGEPLDFRGLRHAPINEQGVVYLFGLVSHELGFLIEAIQTGFPDCEGKRLVDQKQQRWERVLIEFEFESRNFYEHGHNPNDCDLIVCWIDNWDECPLDVLELRSQIQYLPTH